MKFKAMMSLFLVFGLTWIFVNGNAQDTKLNRREKKEVREAQMTQNYYIMDSLFQARSFVLEADWLQDKYGTRIPVMPDLNFIKVNETNGVLQTGTPTGRGYNGVGGVTAEGSIGSWKVIKNPKRLSYTLNFGLLTNIGHYDVFLTVTADNHATATITGLGPGELTWQGHLETVDNSRIFKGQNTI